MSNSYRKSAECNQIKMAFILWKVGFFRYQLSCSKYILLVTLSTVQMSTKHAEKYKQVVKNLSVNLKLTRFILYTTNHMLEQSSRIIRFKLLRRSYCHISKHGARRERSVWKCHFLIGPKLARRRLYNKSVEVARVAREVEVSRERQRQGAERG